MDVDLTLDSVGSHKSRSGQEEHLYNPLTIHLLQEATRRGDYSIFKQYTATLDDQGKTYHLRNLMDFNYPEDGGIPIDQVESVDSIVRRFKTGAMSYGSISQEAHETLAIAMNRIHGKSNTGEGGESLDRLDTGTFGPQPLFCDQAGSFRPFRCYQPLSGKRPGDPDQDGPGRKTW